MIRLYCDNLHEFINEDKVFYTVEDGHPHKEEDEVILYNECYEHPFKITLIQFGNVLSLEPIKEEVGN